MAIYSKLTIGGSTITDSYNYSVNKSIGENNISSSFDGVLENITGRHSTDWNVGDEIIVYADKDVNPPTTKIFVGILEDKKFSGKEEKEKLNLAGRDYTARLMDRTVEPEVYTSLPAGSIVKDIVSKYVDGINAGSVQDSPTTIDRITFSHMPVYDAIKKLADLATYTFYVDNDKYLHFEEKSSISSGQTFNNTNLTKADFKEQRDTLYNQIWVYGDRYLDGYKETFTANGGSLFTLLYNPHNTEVTSSGLVVQPGEIEDIGITPGSNVKYMVNYNDKKVTFISGTQQGDNIPASGVSVVVNYKRSLPIVKVGDNELSKVLYGTRVKVIQDKDIKDPLTAEQILSREMDKSNFPVKEGKLDVKGVVNITPGQTCIVNIPYYNIYNTQYDILEANYNFNKENNLAEDVLNIRVNKKISDITDTMKDIILQLKKLQAQDISTSDLLTRYQYTAGSFGVASSGCVVSTSTITGSGLYCYWDGGDLTTTGTLASGTNQKGVFGEGVGSPFSPFTISWSGCYTDFAGIQSGQPSGGDKQIVLFGG